MTVHITCTLYFAPEPLHYADIVSPKESHIKNTLQLPERCVIRQAFIGMLATCCGTWMRLLPWDLARLWPLSSTDLGIAVFRGGGNETAAGGCSELALLQRESASKRGGPPALKETNAAIL